MNAALQFPTDETLTRLLAIADSHSDKDVRLLASILAQICPATEAIGRAVASASTGRAISFGVDSQNESAER